MRGFTLEKHTKICSKCHNEFVDKIGTESVCGMCKFNAYTNEADVPKNIGNGALEMDEELN